DRDLIADADLARGAGNLERIAAGGELGERLPGGALAVAQRDQRQIAAQQVLVAVRDRMMARLLIGMGGDEGRRGVAQVDDGRVLAVTRGVLDGADDPEREETSLLGADRELIVAGGR